MSKQLPGIEKRKACLTTANRYMAALVLWMERATTRKVSVVMLPARSVGAEAKIEVCGPGASAIRRALFSVQFGADIIDAHSLADGDRTLAVTPLFDNRFKIVHTVTP